jgi:hypothetical protein
MPSRREANAIASSSACCNEIFIKLFHYVFLSELSLHAKARKDKREQREAK